MSISAQPKRLTEEFKIEAVRQVTERGHRVNRPGNELTPG